MLIILMFLSKSMCLNQQHHWVLSFIVVIICLFICLVSNRGSLNLIGQNKRKSCSFILRFSFDLILVRQLTAAAEERCGKSKKERGTGAFLCSCRFWTGISVL